MNKKRCAWSGSSPLYQKYHDTEWGVPVYSDKTLFEFLILEGAQAGLNWLTILKKREAYQEAFCNFNPEKVAKLKVSQLNSLLKKSDIVRNRLKVFSAVKNAQSFLGVQDEFGSFSNYLWCFTDGESIQNKWKTSKDVPVKTEISESLSKDLKLRGFSFVGPTIIYAYMQAVGMVNDHTLDCYRHKEIERETRA